MQGSSAPPPLQLFVLSHTGLECYEGAPKFERREGAFNVKEPSLISLSEDGAVLFVASEDLRTAHTFESVSGRELASWKVDCPIVKAYVSPLGSFVLTWHYPPRSKAGEPEPAPEQFENLIVWDAKSGKVVQRTKMKNSPETHMWPSVQWTTDERYAARMTTNTVFIHTGNNLAGPPEHGIHVKGVAQFSLVQGGAKRKDGSFVKQYRVATFVPEKNNTMAQVAIWRVYEKDQGADDEGGVAPTEPIVKEATKTFGRGQNVAFLWNNLASALIVKAFSAVDTSGGSYYGTYDCHYLRSDQSVDVTLRPKREGTIHDVQWDVSGRRFVIVYGPQPASATVYNLKANAITEFGTGSRNFASFSPSGNMLTLAGFGSLKGAIEIWDHKSVKKAAIAESFAASTFQWAPDSRFFLTAVLSDRMKVDNVVKVFAYDGTLVKEINTENKTKLLKAVAWRPSPRGVYESRPVSPRCFEKAAAAERTLASAPVRQKYVPPGMRGAGATAPKSSTATALLHDLRGGESSNVVGRVTPPTYAPNINPVTAPKPVARQLLVGEVPDEVEETAADAKSKAAEKNRRRREAKRNKLKTGSEGGGGGGGAARPAGGVHDEDDEEGDELGAYPTDAASIEKRLRKLKKKLRQLEALKSKDAASLLPEQRQKLAEEEKLLKVVADLEALRK